MEITVRASLFTKRDMDINTGQTLSLRVIDNFTAAR